MKDLTSFLWIKFSPSDESDSNWTLTAYHHFQQILLDFSYTVYTYWYFIVASRCTLLLLWQNEVMKRVSSQVNLRMNEEQTFSELNCIWHASYWIKLFSYICSRSNSRAFFFSSLAPCGIRPQGKFEMTQDTGRHLPIIPAWSIIGNPPHQMQTPAMSLKIPKSLPSE